MKVISLWAPWAWLLGVPDGKIHETRSWPANYTGPIAIHAAKRWTRAEKDLCLTDPFLSVLYGEYGGDCSDHIEFAEKLDKLPRGGIVATGYLKGCYSTGGSYENRPCWLDMLRPNDRAFGDFSPNRFAWRTENVKILPVFIPYRGEQGLFDVPNEIFQQVAA